MDFYNTKGVFTPTSPAKTTFIERNIKINDHLVDSLHTPGKQIVLYGHSGCGKSTLIINKLNQIYENTITTRCMEGMTFESIIVDGFDQLEEVYSEKSNFKSININPKFSLGYNNIKASLSLIEFGKGSSSTQKRLIPPQLTPQRLAGFFGASNTCWILEDFHKIKGKEKTKAAQLMKVFMDMSVEFEDLKLIAIGAVNSARQVVEYDNEMNNRVAEINVPYMNKSEIESIISQGEKLLNLKFPKEAKIKIVQYSCGLPSICHQLCLNMCFNNKIYGTSKDKFYFKNSDLNDAIEKFVEEKSDTLKASYDMAVRMKNGSTTNIPKQIIKTALKLNKDEFSLDEIQTYFSNPKEKTSKIEKYINELCTNQRGEVLIYDEISNRYRFNNLFLKNYALLQLRDETDSSDYPKSDRDQRIVDRLLDIIEKDILDDYEFYIEEL